MHDVLQFSASKTKNQFKIDYPYYGLFGSADVTTINENTDVIYQCRLLNGSIILLKKLVHSKRWIDASVNKETPLASIIGTSIDDFLGFSR